jgi:excisionase family DNA binding protein
MTNTDEYSHIILSSNDVRFNAPANMSVKQASSYVGVSERKLRSSIANHEVKHIRFGSRVILRKIDLDSFLEGLVA